MKNRIVTISREFGSGGRTIGKLVAQKLGIPCYDAEIIQKIAQESGFSEGYIREAGEYTPGGALANLFSNRAYGPTNEDYLWKIQYQIITELARKESCVIVGRCADYILRDTADCLKVFIHADMDFRSKRIVEVYGERENSPPAARWRTFSPTVPMGLPMRTICGISSTISSRSLPKRKPVSS